VDVATQPRIENLVKQWIEAERLSNAQQLEAVLTDDFLCVGPFGFVIDRQQYVGSLQSGDLKHTAFDWSEPRMRQYASTVIVIGRQTQTSTFQGRDASGQFRVTLVATELQNQWRIASLHFCAIAQPPGAPGR